MTEFKKDNKDPKGQSGTTYSEKEYKDLQAFGTKANQGLIDVSKKLAEKDPKELIGMEASIQNKVIKDIWGYDSIDELKSFLPEVLGESEEDNSGGGEGFESNDTYKKLLREQELLKYKLNKKDVNDEVEKFITAHSELLNSVPNFKEKVIDELKYISSDLPTRERVDRATKLVSGNSDVNVEAYLQLQGKNVVKSSSQKMTDDYVTDAQNKLRASLGLKIK